MIAFNTLGDSSQIFSKLMKITSHYQQCRLFQRAVT